MAGQRCRLPRLGISSCARPARCRRSRRTGNSPQRCPGGEVPGHGPLKDGPAAQRGQVRPRPPGDGSARPSGHDQAGSVHDHRRVDPVLRTELGQHIPDVRLHRLQTHPARPRDATMSHRNLAQPAPTPVRPANQTRFASKPASARRGSPPLPTRTTPTTPGKPGSCTPISGGETPTPATATSRPPYAVNAPAPAARRASAGVDDDSPGRREHLRALVPQGAIRTGRPARIPRCGAHRWTRQR
ncbi:hypothetical protein SALBM135S_05607 [Streptomyces alboniger]